MRALNRSTIYSKVVPALAILLGLSYGFTDNEPLQRALSFALAATAALGWLAPASCDSDRREQRRIERHERHDLRRLERSEGSRRGASAADIPAAEQRPGQTPGQAPGQTQGIVLDGVPQDRLPGEGTTR